MAQDDLNAPLGQDKQKKLAKLPTHVPQLLAGLLGLFALTVVGWAIFGNNPLGGEPVAVVATPAPAGPAKNAVAGDGRQHERYSGPATAAATKSNSSASATITIIDGSSGKHREIVIPHDSKVAAATTPVNQQLLQYTKQGSIPSIGPDGTRPSLAYARPRPLPANRKNAPRIAIVVGGLGVSTADAAAAFAKLPAPITFAFAPDGTGLEALVEQARAANHEVLLQVPMEPFDYADNDPGPHTLLTSLSADQNIDRLHWLMSRFHGYVGLMSYAGGRFTSSQQALTPVLREAAKRGLLYVDAGPSPRGVAGQIAEGLNLPFAKADVVLDAAQPPADIHRALARLEMTARERGSAVGIVNAQPTTIAQIAAWAKTVESQGFVLVPISMVALKTKSS